MIRTIVTQAFFAFLKTPSSFLLQESDKIYNYCVMEAIKLKLKLKDHRSLRIFSF